MRQKVQLILILVIMTTALGRNATETSPERKRLRDDLLKNYEREILPNRESEPVIVSLKTFSVQRVDVDEAKEQLILHAWAGFEWKDYRLTWDPEKYGKIKSITFNPKDVWMPDLTFYNAIDPKELELVGTTRVVISSDGNVLQVSPFQVGFTCVLDLSFWPNDRQRCALKIGSWTRNAFQIDFKISELPNPDFPVTVLEWKVLNTDIKRQEVYYECCPEPYVNLELTLQVQRQASFYNWIIKAPAICLTILTLVLFTLPPAATVKLTFGGVCLILELIFLVFTTTKIHQPPTQTPLMIQLVIAQLVLTSICVIVSAWVVRVSTGPFFTSPSSSSYRFAAILAPALGLSSYVDQTETGKYMNDKEMKVEKEEDKNKKSQWNLLAATFDRLVLGVHFLISVTLIIRIFIYT